MVFTAQLGDNGRLVIPAKLRRALGLKDGDEVLLILDQTGLRMVTRDQAVRSAQELVRRFVPEGRMLSDELITERRAEAGHE